MRVVEIALHCQRRADSAKLFHECRSGSSDGHHPSPDDRPTSYSTGRQISLGGLRCGRQFHCRTSLRRPGLFTPPVNRALGTRSPPLASYLVQCAQPQRKGLAVPHSSAAERARHEGGHTRARGFRPSVDHALVRNCGSDQESAR